MIKYHDEGNIQKDEIILAYSSERAYNGGGQWRQWTSGSRELSDDILNLKHRTGKTNWKWDKAINSQNLVLVTTSSNKVIPSKPSEAMCSNT